MSYRIKKKVQKAKKKLKEQLVEATTNVEKFNKIISMDGSKITANWKLETLEDRAWKLTVRIMTKDTFEDKQRWLERNYGKHKNLRFGRFRGLARPEELTEQGDIVFYSDCLLLEGKELLP